MLVEPTTQDKTNLSTVLPEIRPFNAVGAQVCNKILKTQVANTALKGPLSVSTVDKLVLSGVVRKAANVATATPAAVATPIVPPPNAVNV